MKTIKLICLATFTILACQITSGIVSNSDIVFLGFDSGIYIMDQNGSNIKKLVDSGLGIYPPIKWSPDKKQIAYLSVIEVAGKGRASVYIMNSDGSNQRPINATITEVMPSSFEWSPDGGKILILGSSGFYITNVQSGETSYRNESETPSSATWSPDSALIAVTTMRGILIVDVNKKEIQQTINPPGIASEIIWSADGKKIAFSANDIPACKGVSFTCSGIFVMNANGSELVQLIDKTDSVYRISDWTPDGKYILFDGESTALIEVNTSEIIEISKSINQSVLSRDGKFVLYADTSDGKICKTKIDDLSEICLTNDSNGGSSPDW
jgi:Tol biopolymer transport system component